MSSCNTSSQSLYFVLNTNLMPFIDFEVNVMVLIIYQIGISFNLLFGVVQLVHFIYNFRT